MAGGDIISSDHQTMDRMGMLKEFDETRLGVKGLLDSGIEKIPNIFVRPSEELFEESAYKSTQIQVPVIDLSGIHDDPEGRKKVIEEVKAASEIWGFFQVVNHGIPSTVLDGMIEGIREFNEGDIEDKKKFYTRDLAKKVKFNSNFDLYSSKTAGWRDTLSVFFLDKNDAEELPACCRNGEVIKKWREYVLGTIDLWESTVEYSKHALHLGSILLELLSEALGLNPGHLNKLEVISGCWVVCHYYPACPQPELAQGLVKHSDMGFLTILLQNQVSGLQVMYQNQWIDVNPTPGALVINIGDLLQLVSNGKFVSSMHRVVANRIGPRISVACFLGGPNDGNKIYGPIEELVSKENPAVYKEVLLRDYVIRAQTGGHGKKAAIDCYRL